MFVALSGWRGGAEARGVGQLSDRLGRTRILGCAVVGLLIADLTFLCVFWFYDYIPGGYWFLLLGPLVEGFLGGKLIFWEVCP